MRNAASVKYDGFSGIGVADGILFPALTKGNLSLRINMGDDGIQLGSKNLEVTIKELKAGQHVTIILKSANATSGRGISAITNIRKSKV